MESVESLHKVIPGLDLELLKTLVSNFPISSWTPVQKDCIPHLISHKDVVVQAATGSGKTLAYLMPTIHIMLKESRVWNKWQIGALILVPARELADQVYEWACKIKGDLVVQCFTGGSKTETNFNKFKEEGCNILIGTPGRLEELFTGEYADKLSGHLRKLEVLILDEADRLLDMGFAKSLSSILAQLPKQRRTGLFSATQAKLVEDLIKAGLRNPIRITVSASSSTASLGIEQSNVDELMVNDSVPLQLHNFYTIVAAQNKFACLLKFLEEHQDKKILIFFSTCACVDYFSQFLKSNLKMDIVALHGKQKKKRNKLFQKFKKMAAGVAVSTDVMARGIDLPDIDWVIQYDPPKQSSWYLHRSGRSGRGGREGNSLIILHPSEKAYVEYLEKSESIKIEKLKLTVSKEYSKVLRCKFIDMASKKREFLEAGSKAFVSYIQSYCKHDCNIVCSIGDLDVANVANSYGLIRFPKLRELRSKDVSAFMRSDIDTSTIKYKDKAREKGRQAKIEDRASGKGEEVVKTFEKKVKKIKVDGGIDTSRRRRLNDDDIDDINEDFRLMKKLKKGRLSKLEFESQFLDGS